MAIRSNKTRVLIDNHNLSTSLNEASNAAEQEELDVSNFESSAFREFITGFRGGQFNVSGWYTFSTSTSSDAPDPTFYDLLQASTNPIITYAVNDDIGGGAQLFRAVETSVEQTASVGDAVGIAAVFRNDEGPEFGQTLHSHGTESSTGASTSAQYKSTAGSTGGGVGHLHVTAHSSGSTGAGVVVKIQHSSDDSNWSDLITFSTFTGETVERSTVAGTVKEFLREQRTAFDSTSATYYVAFGRS